MKIIYENDDGGVSVVHPALNSGLTIEEIAEKDVPPGKPYQIVEDSVVPSDRTFRNAWEKDDVAIKVNMDKAKIIHMDRIREVRDKELKFLDINILLLEDMEQPVVDQRKRRQTLRDLPATFDLTKATTPDELKTLWPADLPKP